MAINVLIGALSALVVAALGGCHSAPTRLYTLKAVPSAERRSAYSGPAVRIEGVHVPGSLDRIEITTQPALGQLKINELDHWSAPLARLTQEALSSDLSTRLPPGKVISPHLSKAPGDLGVWIDILEMGPDEQGTHLTVSWQFKVAGMPPPTGHEFVKLEAGGGALSPAAFADQTSELLGQLADRIAAGLIAWNLDRP